MLVQQRTASPEALAAKSASSLAGKLGSLARGGSQPKSAAADTQAVGSQQPQTPSKSAGQDAEAQASANDQNRGLVPEGSQESQQPQSAEGEQGQQSQEAGSEEPPTGATAKTKKKWQRVLQQKAAAAAENAELKNELAALRAEVASIRGGAPQPTQPQQQEPVRKVEFKEPYPENGTEQEQFMWQAKKQAHESAVAAFNELYPQYAGESFRKFATVISPALQHTVEQMANKQWEGLSDKLDALGVSVSDIRPAVEQEVTNNPGLGIEEALGRVLFNRNFSQHWQEVEEGTTAPAKPARPAGPARAASGRLQNTETPTAEQARELLKQGQKFKSQALMGAYLRGLVKPKR